MGEFTSRLYNSNVVAVVCNQFGDTGKGKFTDYIAADWADIIARGTGGNNAGHTVVDDDGTVRKYHGIPSGVKYDSVGKVNVLGNGMVIDPVATGKELKRHLVNGGTLDNLMISQDAFVITPYHVVKDLEQNHSLSGIGSTGKGIGPAYADKNYRMGIKIGDLADKDKISKRLRKSLFYKGLMVVDGQVLDHGDIVDMLYESGQELRPYTRDTIAFMHKAYANGKKILLEGAQGLLLSSEFGVYPYVTSSDPSVSGTAAGAGLTAKAVDLALGIVKFPFMSKVGGGPFPTEMGGRAAEEYSWPKEVNLESELAKAGVPFTGSQAQKNIRYDHRHPKILEMVNSGDALTKNRGICLTAEEFGVTTGRKRRIGWTDLVALKYAATVNGPFFVLTRPDVLSGIDEFSLSTGYIGPDGREYDDFSRDAGFLKSVEPSLESYRGYGNIKGAKSYSDLPEPIIDAIGDLEDFTGGQVLIVSNGAEKSQTILR